MPDQTSTPRDGQSRYVILAHSGEPDILKDSARLEVGIYKRY